MDGAGRFATSLVPVFPEYIALKINLLLQKMYGGRGSRGGQYDYRARPY
jgi:hypothetical protein